MAMSIGDFWSIIGSEVGDWASGISGLVESASLDIFFMADLVTISVFLWWKESNISMKLEAMEDSGKSGETRDLSLIQLRTNLALERKNVKNSGVEMKCEYSYQFLYIKMTKSLLDSIHSNESKFVQNQNNPGFVLKHSLKNNQFLERYSREPSLVRQSLRIVCVLSSIAIILTRMTRKSRLRFLEKILRAFLTDSIELSTGMHSQFII